jgi:hypothetical protein
MVRNTSGEVPLPETRLSMIGVLLVHRRDGWNKMRE